MIWPLSTGPAFFRCRPFLIRQDPADRPFDRHPGPAVWLLQTNYKYSSGGFCVRAGPLSTPALLVYSVSDVSLFWLTSPPIGPCSTWSVIQPSMTRK